jgi:hypothetical protein
LSNAFGDHDPMTSRLVPPDARRKRARMSRGTTRDGQALAPPAARPPSLLPADVARSSKTSAAANEEQRLSALPPARVRDDVTPNPGSSAWRSSSSRWRANKRRLAGDSRPAPDERRPTDAPRRAGKLLVRSCHRNRRKSTARSPSRLRSTCRSSTPGTGNRSHRTLRVPAPLRRRLWQRPPAGRAA